MCKVYTALEEITCQTDYYLVSLTSYCFLCEYSAVKMLVISAYATDNPLAKVRGLSLHRLTNHALDTRYLNRPHF